MTSGWQTRYVENPVGEFEPVVEYKRSQGDDDIYDTLDEYKLDREIMREARK